MTYNTDSIARHTTADCMSLCTCICRLGPRPIHVPMLARMPAVQIEKMTVCMHAHISQHVGMLCGTHDLRDTVVI